MSLECELKYLDANLEALSMRLREAGGDSTGPYLESNLVFDDSERSLKKAGTLLRLREKRGRAVLTVKKLPDEPHPSALKVFEEIETGVDDFDAMRLSLETVGFSVAFGYEKVREKWLFMGCAVCLDRLPFGDFVEIEGSEESVPACAAALGLDDNRTTKSTYHALNIEHRAVNGLEPDENFLFSGAKREEILRQMGKD
ncbi:CYTH domain-containing protein [Pseudodesulfovibrio cashew]|uniref:CYTH domain-containing protein n=1 Tax=Pseudodesulfovibrio cashew TaxID=2678688 RepID=A0A6I6JK44_9BACT|nr:class IV adenylate cyclase [Pseudodesulfovibrio cashew]QGY41360.1 CYTH domain-containing protein [Pseudodesulfovibrio cashew]